jgi:hypothetical protein
MFRKLDLFPSSGEERQTPILLGPAIDFRSVSEAPNSVGVSLPSPEDRSRPSFRNVVLSSHLEFWTVDSVHKLADSECYAVVGFLCVGKF